MAPAAPAHASPLCTDLSMLIASEPEAVRAALQKVMLHLVPARLTDDLLGSLELILAEVLNNIVEHAYAGGGGEIALALGMDHVALWCEIADRGAAFPGGSLPAGAPAAVDVAVDDLPEGGFGWFLIRTLARDIGYRRDGNTNRLRFSLALTSQTVEA